MMHLYPEMAFLDIPEGMHWHYAPQEDITTHELAQLIELFSFAVLYKDKQIDWKQYVTNNGLTRHFVVKPMGTW